MTFATVLSERILSANYLRRAESALSIAQLVGDTAWKITALADAVTDARKAFDDWREVFRAHCEACDGAALFFRPCASCNR